MLFRKRPSHLTVFFIFLALSLVVVASFFARSLIESPTNSPVPTQGVSLPKNVHFLVPVHENKIDSIVTQSFGNMSIEIREMCTLLTLSTHDPHFVTLLNNLSPIVLRAAAGRSKDHAVWQPNGQMQCGSGEGGSPISIVTKSEVDQFVALMKKVHWKFTWALRLYPELGHEQEVLDEARYVSSIAGDSLIAFSMGNEPELFKNYGIASSSWNFDTYWNIWNSYRQVIKQALPRIKFAGPDSTNPDWIHQFALKHPDVDFLDKHYYPANYNAGGITVERLLGVDTYAKENMMFLQAKQDADALGVPLVITETNSASGGGVPGVSDALAGALWGIEYSLLGVSDGVLRIHFHNTMNSQNHYSAWDAQGHVMAMYYSLLFLHQIDSGKLVAYDGTFPDTLHIYPIKERNGKLQIVVIDTDPSLQSVLQFSTDDTYHKSSVITLRGNSLRSDTITLGKQAVAHDDSWKGELSPLQVVHGTTVSLHIAPASAALITLW